MKSAIILSLASLGCLLYLFGYLPVTTANAIKKTCDQFIIGESLPNMEEIKMDDNVNYHEYPNDNPSIENPYSFVIAGGWMTSCHVSHFNGIVLTAKYLSD